MRFSSMALLRTCVRGRSNVRHQYTLQCGRIADIADIADGSSARCAELPGKCQVCEQEHS